FLEMFDTSSDGIRSLIAKGESATVEFKSYFTFEALRRHAFAFANSGGGIIIFGIAANGQVLGLSDTEIHTAFSRLRSRLLELRGILVNYGVVSLDSRTIEKRGEHRGFRDGKG
ncbi:MAG TPA: RNA-binding domain-containing protein, partial [Ktedonobacteraceae bacterium]|nr:RNA-binding domain-containing protein [Ktedonobacteraceae bacterium]